MCEQSGEGDDDEGTGGDVDEEYDWTNTQPITLLAMHVWQHSLSRSLLCPVLWPKSPSPGECLFLSNNLISIFSTGLKVPACLVSLSHDMLPAHIMTSLPVIVKFCPATVLLSTAFTKHEIISVWLSIQTETPLTQSSEAKPQLVRCIQRFKLGHKSTDASSQWLVVTLCQTVRLFEGWFL